MLLRNINVTFENNEQVRVFEHFVLDVPSPIWGFGESSTIVGGIVSLPANVLSNVNY